MEMALKAIPMKRYALFSTVLAVIYFLGVTDSGRVVGVPENSVSSMIKNFISCVSNSDLITPTVYLEPRPLLYEVKP